MKLVSFEDRSGAPAVGVQVGERIAPVGVGDMTTLLANGAGGLEAARGVAAWLQENLDEDLEGVHHAGALTLLPAVPNPAKCFCVARNYAAHAAETNRDLPSHPSLFLRVARSLVGDGGAIEVPRVSDRVDWEGELAVVIGRRGRFIAKDHAYDHVAGYSIFNDVSIRDYQMHTQQFTAGKNFDASGPFGPSLVTADEIANPMDLEIRTLVNGEVKQSANSGEMVFDIPELIAYISEFTTLTPGDVIATGTPAGVGVARTPPEYLKAGDTCTITIEGLGELSNPVIAG